MHEANERALDLSGILDSAHENKWVAIAPDYSKVIAVSESLRDLMREVDDADVVYHRVLPRNISFAPVRT